MLCLLPASRSFLAYSSIPKMEVTYSPKRLSTFNGLHGVACHKMGLFKYEVTFKQTDEFSYI
jgi:hypothetical protein